VRSLVLLVALAGCAASGTSHVADDTPPGLAAESQFLHRFVGRWLGEGESYGKQVRDEMVLRWVLKNRFLEMEYRAVDGDDYVGRGYLWWNPAQRRYELYEFNNGAWPIRFETGQRTGETLLLEERAEDRHVRLRFVFVDDDTILMTESAVKDGGEALFVRVRFRKQPDSAH